MLSVIKDGHADEHDSKIELDKEIVNVPYTPVPTTKPIVLRVNWHCINTANMEPLITVVTTKHSISIVR